MVGGGGDRDGGKNSLPAGPRVPTPPPAPLGSHSTRGPFVRDVTFASKEVQVLPRSEGGCVSLQYSLSPIAFSSMWLVAIAVSLF